MPLLGQRAALEGDCGRARRILKCLETLERLSVQLAAEESEGARVELLALPLLFVLLPKPLSTTCDRSSTTSA
jgi:hypothetical protein